MNLASLDAFLAVASGNGIRGAAKLLARSPATVSNVVRDLEEELDAQLFVRQGRTMRLTPAGETFRRYAHEITHSMRKAVAALKDERESSRIKLGVSHEAIGRSVLSALERSLSYSGGEMLDVTVGENSELMKMVIAGKLDGAFVVKPPRDYTGQAALWDTCRRTLSRVDYGARELVLLGGSPLARNGDGSNGRLLVQRVEDVGCFLAERFTKAQGMATIVVEAEATLLTLLASGQGCTVLPREQVCSKGLSEKLVISIVGYLQTMLLLRESPGGTYLQNQLGDGAVVLQPS